MIEAADTPEKDRPRWPFAAAGVVGVLVAGYLALAWWTTTRLPAEARISGVQVGGLDRDAAVAALRAGLAEQVARPLTLRVGAATAELQPAELGLDLDYESSVADALAFTLDPRVIASRLGHGEASRSPVAVQQDALEAGLQRLATSTATAATDGSMTFADGKIARVEPADGSILDADAAVDVLRHRWPEQTTITLPTDPVRPTIDASDLAAVQREFAAPATAGPITFTVSAGEEATRVTLQPAQFTSALSIEPRDGALVGVVDGERLKAALLGPGTGLGTAAQNARFEFRDGTPALVPAVNGVTLDPAAAKAALTEAISAADRTAPLAAVVSAPEISTAALQGAGVQQVVSEFATRLAGSSGRRENIRVAAETISGTYLAPGQTFSMNDTLGRRTAEKGYNRAPAIKNGRLVLDTGGGVSQVATTLFNGMFFAGLKDVEHKPHSFYISRYPAGREATVNYPNVDLKFTNDSPHGVLIRMWVADGQVHTQFWSTKVWDVTAEQGPRTNYRAPTTIRDDRSGCVSQSASAGFDIVVTRVFAQGGVERKRERFHTSYIAEDRVICGT